MGEFSRTAALIGSALTAHSLGRKHLITERLILSVRRYLFHIHVSSLGGKAHFLCFLYYKITLRDSERNISFPMSLLALTVATNQQKSTTNCSLINLFSNKISESLWYKREKKTFRDVL